MVKINNKELLTLIIRLCIAAAFIFAAFPKIQAPLEFSLSIQTYKVIPPDFALWVAIGLPWLELVCGVGILAPQLRQASSSLLAMLLIVFTCLQISARVRGLDLNCGCYGADSGLESTTMNLLRNLTLLSGCCLVYIRDRTVGTLRSHIMTH